MATKKTLSELADEHEERQMKELGDRIVGKSLFYFLSDGEVAMGEGFANTSGKKLLMGEDPRLRNSICCRAPTWRRRTVCRSRWCWPACCTTSRYAALSGRITATGAPR